MWCCYAILLHNCLEGDVSEPSDLGSGIRLERVPSWVGETEYLEDLAWYDRERIREGELAFAVSYEADALGSRDPEWKGEKPRSTQEAIREKFGLLCVALWLVKPSRLSCGPVLHFERWGQPTSLRQVELLQPIVIAKQEYNNVISQDDLRNASNLLKIILSVNRSGTVGTAISLMHRALSEKRWDLRYLLHWIVLEALFGPQDPREASFRLAQRIGLFLESNPVDRKRLFKDAREAYQYRSKIVHGRKLSGVTETKLTALIATTDSIVRQALTQILTMPDILVWMDGKDRESALDDLAFG
jgi:hypothetical protein